MHSHWISRGFQVALVAVLLSRTSMGQPSLTHGPILGGVSSDGIKVWARSSESAAYDVAYAPSAGGLEVTTGTTLFEADDLTGVVKLTGLDPSTEYDYRVLLDDTEAFAGTFATLPPSGAPGVIRFAYGADLRLDSQPYAAFHEVIARQPNFMILGGDNVYVDSPTLVADTKSAYEDRYKATWTDPALRAAMQQIPMFMQWDDHEILNDWSAGQSGRYLNARVAFDEYQGSHNPDPIVPDELYYSFSAGEVDFFVLDNRSHRSPNSMPDGPSKTMLGVPQRDALLEWLDDATGKFKFIVSSVPFHDWSTTGDDSWNGLDNSHGAFLTERNQIFEYIHDQGIRGVVLLSGDQHWSGAFRLDAFDPYFLYEFTPTPTGVVNRPAPTVVDSQILYTNDEFIGFGMFTVDTTVRPSTLRYEWIDSAGTQRFELVLTENDISPVPEPSTFVLAIVGIIGLSAYHRRCG